MDDGLISVDRWGAGERGVSCVRTTPKVFLHLGPEGHSSAPSSQPNSSHSNSPISISPLLYSHPPHWTLAFSRSGSETIVQVIAIDAHDCPVSVMLLFRGEFGSILHTGDCRWEASSERTKRGRDVLLSALKDDVVDTLYLDNTYCNPSYDFPTRQLAAQQVIDIIVSNPEHYIIIGIDTLGKEDLLIHISRVLKIKIWVWPERFRTMHLLGFHDIFTTNTALTRVRAVPLYSFSNTLEGLNRSHPTIGIMASGIPWVTKPLEKYENLFGSFLTYRYKRGKCSCRKV